MVVVLLGVILFFLLFGWLGVFAAGGFLVYFFWGVILLFIGAIILGLIAGLSERFFGSNLLSRWVDSLEEKKKKEK